MTTYLSLSVSVEDFARPDFERWLAKLVETTRISNEERWRLASRSLQDAINHAASVFGEKSRQVRYLKNEGVPSPPNLSYQKSKALKGYRLWCDEQHRLERRERNRQKREAKRLAAIEEHRRERAHKLPLERALRYRSKATDDELRLAGYEPGEDYRVTGAIMFARRLNYSAMLNEEMQEKVEQLYDFNDSLGELQLC